ncbi:glycosyltransferase [Candidatus Sororendozoicomonas aggregata]|uniref:glycosyltransferase n=1 Tax=Candidatus Sororendozoicomonas aggregata TaxID=3073239 RepID=UPI002ED4E8B0
MINESKLPLDEGKPVVSFILCAYNQETYIEAAIKGAFSQTYSPLEIILTDDCSTDSTFTIMEKMAENYKGEHTVRLNRNAENSGISAHFSKAVSLSRGEFIIGAAGDDISLPEYTETLANCWLKSDKKKLLVHSNAFVMAEDSTLTGDVRKVGAQYHDDLHRAIENDAHTVGAATGYSRRLFTEFPPIDPEVVHEDRVLPIRALLLGEIGYIDKALIYYREGGISFDYGKEDIYDRHYGSGNIFAKRSVVDCYQKLADLEFFQVGETTIKLAQKKIHEWELIAYLGEKKGASFTMSYKALRNGLSFGFVMKKNLRYQFPKLYHKIVQMVKGKSVD